MIKCCSFFNVMLEKFEIRSIRRYLLRLLFGSGSQ